MKEIIGIISTVLFFELIVILFKIELFDPYRKKKEQIKVIQQSQFVPAINSTFRTRLNTKMYTDYTFEEEARPLFVTEGPCSIKEIDFKDSEGKIYTALSQSDSLK